jgi:hypothetical protein
MSASISEIFFEFFSRAGAMRMEKIGEMIAQGLRPRAIV